MDQFPLGVEFNPTKEEVIRYLQWKLDGEQTYEGTVCDMDINSQHPQDLPGEFKFFFTQRYDVGGLKAKRTITVGRHEIGHWHTNEKKNIYRDSDEPKGKPVLVGQMTALSFKLNDVGTDWLMREFLLPQIAGEFQEWAICNVYKKREGRVNANKRKGKPMLEAPITSGYAGGACGELVSEFASRTCSSKRGKHNVPSSRGRGGGGGRDNFMYQKDELIMQQVPARKVCEEFQFMSQNKFSATNKPYTSYKPYTSQLGNSTFWPGQHWTSYDHVMLPPPGGGVHEKSSLMMPPLQRTAGQFYEEFPSLMVDKQLNCSSMPSSSVVPNLMTECQEADLGVNLIDAASRGNNFSVVLGEKCGPGYSEPVVTRLSIGDKAKGVLHEEEAVLQQERADQKLDQCWVGENAQFWREFPISVPDVDGGFWDDLINGDLINDEVEGDNDAQHDGGEMIQDDPVNVTIEDEEPSALLSFPPEQQPIVHHYAAGEIVPPQPLASSNYDSQLLMDDLTNFDPLLHL